MDISGKITHIYDTEEVSEGKYQKRTFVIKPPGRYNKPIAFYLWNDKVKELDAFNVKDDVLVSFDVKSREYNGRWYTEVTAWKIQGQVKDAGELFDGDQQESTDITKQDPGLPEETDDLPF